ncbi:hypothetical protein [Streptomyces sp. NPDC048248]|uniref:hypothetical protein n=1 Tax=Streptomyces sp. NPDC048248 TaxID=3365523 RepID=UPI0037172123
MSDPSPASVYGSAEVRGAVVRMARREAAVHTLAARYGVTVLVTVMPCDPCGADESLIRASPMALPSDVAQLVPWEGGRGTDEAQVTMLGCEMLVRRALLPALALRDSRGDALTFRTRGVAWAARLDNGRDPGSAIAEADREEACLDEALALGGPVSHTVLPRVLPLPCGTRPHPESGQGRAAAGVTGTRFLSPHGLGPQGPLWEQLYRSCLLEAVAVAV